MENRQENDIQLYCFERGSGAPLIMLHGNGERSDYFKYQIDFFSSSYHVLAVDTRGHGQSPRGTAPFTLNQFADDLRDFMEKRNLAAAILLGFSDGANIAVAFALKYPESVRALILNGGNLYPRGLKTYVRIPLEIAYVFNRWLSGRSERAKRQAELLRLMVREPELDGRTLSAICAPTLVITGTNDMIKKRHTDLIARSIPGAKKVILPGDHFIAFRQSQSFNQAVSVFLEGHDLRKIAGFST